MLAVAGARAAASAARYSLLSTSRPCCTALQLPYGRGLSSSAAALEGEPDRPREAPETEAVTPPPAAVAASPPPAGAPSSAAADATRQAVKRKLRRDMPAPIKLTDRAADRIKDLLAAKPDKVGVRLGVRRRGCNGYSYTLNYADERGAKDEEVADKGVRVFVDPMATFYIVGTTMDWEETELTSEFTFKNPNAKGSCGCGESFNV